MPLKDFSIRWILSSGVGMSLGFLYFLNFLFFLSFGTDFSEYWSGEAVERIDDAEQILRKGLVIGLPIAGAIFTTTQTLALRGFGISYWRWIIAGPIGFLVPLIIIWPIVGIWGNIPGPVEPLTIVGGGMLGTAAGQWIFVVRGEPGAIKWLAFWIIGLALGMLVYVLSASLSSTFYDLYATSWATEVGVIGFLAGSLAAATSCTTIYKALSNRNM